MARKKSPSQRPVQPQKVVKNIPSKKKKEQAPPVSLFDQLEGFLSRNLDKIFWVSFGLTLLFSILLFDIRFSITGDDSSYVERSYDFIHHFIFPGFQGPLYPVVISPFVLLFGIKAIPLKAISLLFMLGFLWFFYRSFRNRIPAFLLTSVMLLLPVGSAILYYASQTYSEALFMFLQALTFMVFFSFFLDKEDAQPFGKLAKQHLVLACCVLGLVLTRSIGYSFVIAISGYFLVKAQWKNLFYFLVSFAIMLLVFNGLKSIVLGIPGVSLTGEVRSLMSKDYYHPEMGQVDFHGILLRFASNSNWYISRGFYSILGFRDIAGTGKLYPVLTVLTFIVLITSSIFVFRKNRYLLFAGIYVLTVLFVTFFIAHTNWKQARFIIPVAPLMILMILSFFFYSLRYKQVAAFRIFIPVLVAITFLMMFKTTIAGVKSARQVEDKYYGLNPDLVNYCKASEWASRNLPAGDMVACRKPSISFIYGNGRKFFGISHMIAFSQDNLIENWKEKDLPYYIINSSAFQTHQVSKELYLAFRNYAVAFGMNEVQNSYSPRFLVLDFPDSIRAKVLQELSAAGIPYLTKPDLLKSQLDSANEKASVIYPDSLLNFLAKAKVTHVMTDNIRISATRKNDHIITMVEWFMNLIEFKYPEIRTKIVQIGADNDEPAVIYRVNYGNTRVKLTQ